MHHGGVTPPSAGPPAPGARLHVVTGKGGTGKTTVAASLALALATGGKRVLLVEVEERQAIAQLFDLPPLPYAERRIALAPGGGEVYALAIDVEAALLEYFAMFYNLGFAARTLKRMGAVEFATTLAPGLRDVLLTGKIKETVVRQAKSGKPLYDAVVVDAPPTGRVVAFLNVTVAMANLARRGPIRTQADGVTTLLHSPQTAVHLVTLLQDMPTTETLEALAELKAASLPVGSIIVNRVAPVYLPATLRPEALAGVPAKTIRQGLATLGVDLGGTDADATAAGLAEELRRHSVRLADENRCRAELAGADVPTLELPTLPDGVDLGELYELAELLPPVIHSHPVAKGG